ncbi:unnamed protein product, partial [Laminaria digitata]
AAAAAAAAAATPPVLTLEEQDQLAKDVNELFRVGNANPTNERAQARVYALWSFAKAYVEDKDRVIVDGGKGAEIRMDALNHVRQRQLRDVVSFFLEDSKNDPAPVEGPDESSSGGSSKSRAGEGKSRDRTEGAGAGSAGPRKRSRSDLSDSDDDEEEEEDDEGRDVTPTKRSREGSAASAGSKGASLSGDDGASKKSDAPPSRRPTFGRVDSSRLTLEATASNLKEADLNLDLGDEDDDEDDDEDGNGDGSKSG